MPRRSLPPVPDFADLSPLLTRTILVPPGDAGLSSGLSRRRSSGFANVCDVTCMSADVLPETITYAGLQSWKASADIAPPCMTGLLPPGITSNRRRCCPPLGVTAKPLDVHPVMGH
jgi:hypothetical protein